MPTATRDAYLETQFHTATPQKLRLMLIEGALRHARQTLDAWRSGSYDSALESLIRSREIVGELTAGVHIGESPLARQVGGLYVYLFSALTEAQQTRDATQLAAIIRVLEEDRETWRQLCDQLGDRPVPAPSAAITAREEVAPASVAAANQFSIDA